MERNAIFKMLEWKDNPDRKPLILKGARQVGKTWLMQEFGRRYYKNSVYFNFDESEDLKSIFEINKNPYRIVELLSMIAGIKIEPAETLIIFDEIQKCPEALNTLKYFKEKAADYVSFQNRMGICRFDVGIVLPYYVLCRSFWNVSDLFLDE